MKHISFSDTSVLVGDLAADTIAEYGAALARHSSADTVMLRVLDPRGNEVMATFLLDAGTTLMAQSTGSTLPEPDNTDAIALMRQRIGKLESQRSAQPMSWDTPDYYDELGL